MGSITTKIWFINKRYLIFKVLTSLVVLFTGGLIYLGWRTGNLVMFQLIEKWGMSDYLKSFRDISTNYSIYEWIKYSIPDGLWLFSYMFLINTVWGNHKCISSYIFLWTLPVAAILSELLQFITIVPGTFDIVDLMCYILAIIFFLIIKLI